MARKKKEEVVVDEAENRSDEVVLPDKFSFKLPVSGKDITIRPWSWGDYTEIAPDIDKIFDIIEGSKLDLTTLGASIKLQDEIHPKLFSGEEIDSDVMEEYNASIKSANFTMMRLMAKLSNLIVPILSAATGLEEDEIKDLNPTDIHTLVMSIYYVNPTVLGNVYQPLVK